MFFKNIFRWSSFLHIQKVPTGIHHIYGSYHLLFSKILLPLYVQLLLLTVCIMSCYSIGPVLSKYRTHFPRKQLYFCRNITCLNIFMYALILYIIPENPYLTAGVWMIILHSLQLFVAKIQKKGEITQ